MSKTIEALFSIQRKEWKSDIFSDADLSWIKKHPFHKLDLPHQHTLTFYFQDEQGRLIVNPTLRFRVYCTLLQLTSEYICSFLNSRPIGTLQIKFQSGAKKHLSDAILNLRNQGQSRFSIIYDGIHYYAHSLKLIQREHYITTATSSSGLLPRATEDFYRFYYLINKDGTLEPLGNLGRRLEFKYLKQNELTEFQSYFDGRLLRDTPFYRGFELIFQKMLNQIVTGKEIVGVPEIERKFLLSKYTRERWMYHILHFIESHPDLSFTLPAPHLFSRIRRYYLGIKNDSNGAEYTIIETLAGEFYLKIKKRQEVRGPYLIRDTQVFPAQSFALLVDQYNLTIQKTFVKYQYQIPFYHKSGSAFVFKVDECQDNTRILNMLELEYSGELNRDARPDQKMIFSLMDGIEEKMRPTNFYSALRHTTETKYHFFMGDDISYSL